MLKEFNLMLKDALIAESSAGNLLKWKIKINSTDIFIKTSSYNSYNNIWLFESYSEIIVSKLLKELGVQNIVDYKPCIINLDNGIKTFGCYSNSFLKDNEQYISIAHLNKRGILNNYAFTGNDGYKQCIKDIKSTLNIDYKDELDTILEIDYIILNEDRHLGNLGFIYNNITGKYRVAPIFDNGNSLFATKSVDNLNYTQDLDRYIKSKPFSFNHDIQINLINKRKFEGKSVTKTLKLIDKLVKYGLDVHRACFIKQLISKRIIL